MEYKRFENKIIARFDKGEEIHETLKKIALKENIKLASINAIGATDNFTVGVFDLETKIYHEKTIAGPHEILSLIGTITTKDNEYYAHLHITCGNENCEAVGGHLNKCYISATCEMVIDIIKGQIDRQFDQKIGINLFKF